MASGNGDGRPDDADEKKDGQSDVKDHIEDQTSTKKGDAQNVVKAAKEEEPNFPSPVLASKKTSQIPSLMHLTFRAGPTVDLFPLANYNFDTKGPQLEKDQSVKDRIIRMEVFTCEKNIQVLKIRDIIHRNVD